MINHVEITKDLLPRLGVNTEGVMSRGFELSDFSLIVERTGISCSIDVAGGYSDEQREFEGDKILKAVSDALKKVGVDQGLSPVEKYSCTMNGRTVELPEDWLK